MKVWHFALCVARMVVLIQADTHAMSPDLDGSENEEEEEEEDDVEHGSPYYDFTNEPPVFACRRNPRWQSNYEECQEYTEWDPDDVWTRVDHGNTQLWLQDKEARLKECLDEAFTDALNNYEWAKCDEENKTEVCEVGIPTVTAHYFREGQGQLMMIENALSEQEAFGLEALSDCVRKLLPNELPFYEVREFGEEESEKYGIYNVQGGNFVTYLQGLLQQYLPGVTASIYNAIQMAYEVTDWSDLGFPAPEELGIRTAEFLHYKQTGQLGSHADSGSVFSISIAMSDINDYKGGYFQLATNDALFKVPRRSAIVFFSESDHSITQITDGERKVFVMELWEEQDVPIGLPRPSVEQFDEHKETRAPYLHQEDGEASGSDEL